jgi:two-component system, NarL family, nitrate/nitrite response regulator NarL
MLPPRSNSLSESRHRTPAEVPWVISGTVRAEKAGKDERNTESACRILIVDRDPMSSDLLACSLAKRGHINASAVSPADLLNALAPNQTDIVVISSELNHHSETGLELATAVSQAHPNVIIVVLLNESGHDSVIKSFRSGARAVFSREHSMVEFIDCVEHVSKGFIWAGSKETRYLLDALRCMPSPGAGLENSLPLTERELQVVRCAAKGKTNKIIASELGLSEHTIKNYLFRAFDKLGVSNRVELLFYLTMRGQGASATREIDIGETVSPDELAAS